MTDPMSDRPAYNQVAERLRRQIYSGELAPGDRLPSEAELIEQFSVSRVTARGAIKDLQAEGLIVTRQGRGSFVHDREPTRPVVANRYHAETEYAAGRVAEPSTSFIVDGGKDRRRSRLDTNFREVRAPKRVAELLGATVKDTVLERRFVLYIDDRPEQITTSYLPIDLVRGTPVADPENEPWSGGTVAQLASLGQHVTKVEESVRARMPTPDEAMTLRLVVGIPVLVVTRRMLTGPDGDRPVEAAVDIVLPSDRAFLEYELGLGE